MIEIHMSVAPNALGEECVRRGKRLYNELSFLLSSRRFGAAVAASEFLDAPGGIDELLFAGEKGMTSRTNTDLNIATRGTGVIYRTARAYHIGLVILWMNTGFHLLKGARNLPVQWTPCK